MTLAINLDLPESHVWDHDLWLVFSHMHFFCFGLAILLLLLAVARCLRNEKQEARELLLWAFILAVVGALTLGVWRLAFIMKSEAASQTMSPVSSSASSHRSSSVQAANAGTPAFTPRRINSKIFATAAVWRAQ